MGRNITYIDTIYTKLIPWCKNNNKKISEIPAYSNDGKINPLYSFMVYLRKRKPYLPKEIINLLEKYGIIWETKYRSAVKRIYDELIPWCEANNKKISDIPKKIEDHRNSLYTFVLYLQNNKYKLNPEIIDLLDKYGMVWDNLISQASDRKTRLEKIKTELIPWCEANNKSILEIPCMVNGKQNPLYHFVYSLKIRKHLLTQEELRLLNEYTKPPKQNKQTKNPTNSNVNGNFSKPKDDNMKIKIYLKAKIKELIAYLDKRLAYIQDIPKGNKYYDYIELILENQKYLDSDQIEELQTYGMKFYDNNFKNE